MRKKGIAYKKGQKRNQSGYSATNSIFNVGESMAFKYWAIADFYSSTDIIVDELPPESELDTFLTTFRAAGIKSVVLTGSAESRIELLCGNGCKYIENCKVFRKGMFIDDTSLEIVKGARIIL